MFAVIIIWERRGWNQVYWIRKLRIYSILIPEGSSDGFHVRFETAYEKLLAKNKEHIYVVKKGDNLSSIANRFDVPLLSLLTWNQLFGKKIYPGNRLVVHPNRIESVEE